jgi:hypothetical protein
MKKIVKHCLCLSVMGVVVFATDYACVFRKYLNQPCLSCGMTRAMVAFLKGEWQEAFRYHPLFLFLPIYVWVLIQFAKDGMRQTAKPWQTFFIAGGFFVIVATYLYRLAVGRML